MAGKHLCCLFFVCLFYQLSAQTTDLSIVVQAQNTGGTAVSQIEIYQDFQYLITIINSGNDVNDASFEITLDEDLQNLNIDNVSSQNNSGGASNASNLAINNSVLTGTIANLPNDSSVELKIDVTAPAQVGGIAITATISPPVGTTDNNTSNNQSLISIDVIDVAIDFTVTHTQISPSEGTAIASWNSLVTYQFTITNNSAIAFPLESISGHLSLLSDVDYGRPNVEMVSLSCISSTGGTDCPDVSGIGPGSPILLSATSTLFNVFTPHTYTSGGSVTFEVIYRYLDPSCAVDIQPISVLSQIEIGLNHANLSSNFSNTVTTDLLESELCQTTDICIDTVQINPDPSSVVNWNEEVTFETTVCNNGPLDANIAFFLQNLSPNIAWQITSVSCTQSTGNITCEEVIINTDDLFWVSDAFILPVGATLTITTTVLFLEPECATNTANNQAHIRSGTNVLEPNIFDSNVENSAQSDYVLLPPTDPCPSSDLSVVKTQITPELPLGETPENPTQAGNVTYEITVTNSSELDTFITLTDFTEQIGSIGLTGTLIAVDCVSSTGNADCFPISNSNVDVPLDGISQGGQVDVFWEITEDDNWSLPANSSVTFHTTVYWETDCDIQAIPVRNSVEVDHAGNTVDSNADDNLDTVITYFAPCVDLVVQTYPEFTQVTVGESFDWVIDITNSENSSNAINILFEDTINDVFTITGDPSCIITDGNATCITNIQINDHVISGTIDNMDAGSTLQIRIPVDAPSFGGAYNNIATATPNANDNLEISPETNTSISNVQIVAPVLDKSFAPETIIIGTESTLTFTISNLPSNPSQSGISFTDNLPLEMTLVSAPQWVTSNGCTATFLGTSGDNFVGVSDLIFPEGVASCSFSAVVSSVIPGAYLNDFNNFTNQNNIDTSQTNATLTVLDDGSNVDIEIVKNVTPQEVVIYDSVSFQISATNVGTTNATEIDIQDVLPQGLSFLSASTSEGFFDPTTSIWSLDFLASGQSETLTIVAEVISNTNLLNVATLVAVNEPDRNLDNNTDFAEVIVDQCLFISQGLSPNNDQKNDVFIIDCIEAYPLNHIKIYNRLGVLVYETKNYQNTWSGKPNKGILNTSEYLPVGTYFYILDLNTGAPPIFGWVYLNY